MALLLEQFKVARARVEPTEDDKANAAAAHGEVRSTLESDERLGALEIDTVLIGSYRRHVSIRRMKDVDVLSKLSEEAVDGGPRALLDLFVDVLQGQFGHDRVRMQDRSIKVAFPRFDLDVDAVPACPLDGHWQIPNRTDRDDPWEETNPEAMTSLAEAMNARHQDLYVPTVKLLRQVRRTHLETRPNGFCIEALTYTEFQAGRVGGANIAEYFTSALANVADGLARAAADGIPDPTLPGHLIDSRATRDDFLAAHRRMNDLARVGERALQEEDRCEAARLFQEILGRNGDEELVFPLPDDCGKKGQAAVVAGDRLVPAGTRRFA